MVVPTELERNYKLQLYHPYVFEVPDVERPPIVPPVRIPPEFFSLPPEGYDFFIGIEEDIGTTWKTIDLYAEAQAIELEADVDAEVRGLGRRHTGKRRMRANETISWPVKVTRFQARAIMGTGKLYGSAVGS